MPKHPIAYHMSLRTFIALFKRGEYSISEARMELVDGFKLSGQQANEILLEAMRIPA